MYLTNGLQFSMINTLVDHKMTLYNVQNSSGMFHCQVLNILWHRLMAYKSTDRRKRLLICFLQ